MYFCQAIPTKPILSPIRHPSAQRAAFQGLRFCAQQNPEACVLLPKKDQVQRCRSVRLDGLENEVGEPEAGDEPYSAHAQVHAPDCQGHVGQVERHGKRPRKHVQGVEQEAQGVEEYVHRNAAAPVK
jgi:hypothetical protein